MKLLRVIGIWVAAFVPFAAFAQVDQQGAFVPLLPSLPGISAFTASEGLPVFLTQLYKICIGAAAVLAVLQLIRAGVMYMGGDSITEKKEARNLIALSIVGLVLVLSPVIVFSIINPSILELDINTTNLRVRIASTTLDLMGPPRDNQPGDLGGSVVAPEPTAPGCSSLGRLPNGSYMDMSGENVNQLNACCSSQENDFATCRVQQQTRSDGTFFPYCGCSFRATTPVFDYYTATWFEVRNANVDTASPVIPPGYRAAYDNYKSTCERNGGRVTNGRYPGAGQYVDCPAASGYNSNHQPIPGSSQPASNYRTYQCTQTRASCQARD